MLLTNSTALNAHFTYLNNRSQIFYLLVSKVGSKVDLQVDYFHLQVGVSLVNEHRDMETKQYVQYLKTINSVSLHMLS